MYTPLNSVKISVSAVRPKTLKLTQIFCGSQKAI
jgi:hypothetical protein